MSSRCQGNTREKLHDSADGSLPPLKLYVLSGYLVTVAYAHVRRDLPSFSHFRREEKQTRLTCVENLPNILILTMSRAEGFSDDVMCPLSGRLLQRTQNHPTVTLDQEQKEELLYEVFDE